MFLTRSQALAFCERSEATVAAEAAVPVLRRADRPDDTLARG
jgi:hypothetical protein